MKEWDEKFKRDNIDLIEKLESGDEMERLWALAKLEEKCYGSGVPNFLIDQIIRCMEQDESSIVRAFAIRVLYHQSSEIWPLDEAKRAKILEAIKKHSRRGESTFDSYIAYEIMEIESCIKWLSDHLWWKVRYWRERY